MFAHAQVFIRANKNRCKMMKEKFTSGFFEDPEIKLKNVLLTRDSEIPYRIFLKT